VIFTHAQWAEMQKQCNRLKLVDLIVKPWQRLTKYKLLLHAMRKPLEKLALEAAMTTQHGHVTHGPSSTEEQMTDIEAMVRVTSTEVYAVAAAALTWHDVIICVTLILTLGWPFWLVGWLVGRQMSCMVTLQCVWSLS